MSLWSFQARGFPSHYLPTNTSARPRRALPWPIPPLKTRQISATPTRQGTERGGLSNFHSAISGSLTMTVLAETTRSTCEIQHLSTADRPPRPLEGNQLRKSR
jgi:hypothetical protein